MFIGNPRILIDDPCILIQNLYVFIQSLGICHAGAEHVGSWSLTGENLMVYADQVLRCAQKTHRESGRWRRYENWSNAFLPVYADPGGGKRTGSATWVVVFDGENHGRGAKT